MNHVRHANQLAKSSIIAILHQLERSSIMLYIIDRFEGSFAICEQENGSFITIPRFHLPKDAKEGDCIQFINNTYVIKEDETKTRSARIEEKLNSLWED